MDIAGNINVIKASGIKAPFDASKLRHSLNRSGAVEPIVSKIIAEVENSLYEGITTRKIYKKAFAMLRKSSRPTAARYKLKKAIYELGPAGYHFEKFVGEILKKEGFRTEVGVFVKGHCVQHEVDVVAQKDQKHFMVECKFHSDQGRHCNVKIPLYIQSRFIDVEKQWKKKEGHDTKFHQGWVFTNTRFTTDAIQYGTCVGLMLVGWDYPRKGSLKERIDKAGLYPITALTTLTKTEKQKLLARNILLGKDLHNNPEILSSIGLKEQRLMKVLSELEELCG